MVQSAKTDFVPSHLSTWVSFLLSEAVGGRRTFSEGGEVNIGGGRNTMGGIWVRGRGAIRRWEYGRWEEYGREGSSGAYLSRKRGAAASQGQRNRFWKIQEINFVQYFGEDSILCSVMTQILNFETLSLKTGFKSEVSFKPISACQALLYNLPIKHTVYEI